MLMGCGWMVPRQGASIFASTDGNISWAWVAPMSRRTSGSLGWTDVPVIMCQNTVRSSTFAGSVDQGDAAVYERPAMTSGLGAMIGSALCTISGSSYVPGTLVPMGSPSPDVVMITNCALSGAPHAKGG